MGQWAIKMWNRDLVIRGVRCWISISILHTSMFYTLDRVSISRERFMIINSNRKLVEVWEQMQHAKKWFRKSFPLFQLASHQFQPVFGRRRKTLATWYFTTALSAARFVVALKVQVMSFFDAFMSLCATLIFKSP